MKLLTSLVRLALVFVITLSVYCKCLAWGNAGHRTTGVIAEKHLCAKTKTIVAKILGGESLAEASIWADSVRDLPEYNYLKPWHYVELTGKTYQQDIPNPKGDLVTAIETLQPQLHSADPVEQQKALRLLIHFMGDTHQPFHAGKREDFGGNGIYVNWFGYPEKLHWVWDNGIIRQTHLDFNALAIAIDSPPQPSVPQLTVIDWVNESASIAQNSYPEPLVANAVLGVAYFDKNVDTVKRRLREAGLRIAEKLNQEFGCN